MGRVLVNLVPKAGSLVEMKPVAAAAVKKEPCLVSRAGIKSINSQEF